MTSGVFASVLVSSIFVDREARQRRELEDVPALANSIAESGLINPIVVTRDLRLVAGERRLEAHKLLGYTHINVQYTDELTEIELHLIELEENVRRVDLPWQDQARAIDTYHKLQQSQNPEWSIDKTAEALNLPRRVVEEQSAVAQELDKGNARVVAASKYTTARDVVRRDKERRKAAVAAEVRETVNPTPMDAPVVEKILHASFLDWAKTYNGPKFNFLHCDFPYGQSHGDGSQITGQILGGYADGQEVYWGLLEALAENKERLLDESCHIIFWYSMYEHQRTLDFLTEELDFKMEPFPLIWKKNAGTIPDANRRPFRKYETALFGWRGDRKIVTAVDNIFDSPVTKDIHISEKPLPMLRHFLRMVVDDTTVMLDPTAGSGNALKVAEMLGAKSVLGTEMNEEFVERALAHWEM